MAVLVTLLETAVAGAYAGLWVMILAPVVLVPPFVHPSVVWLVMPSCAVSGAMVWCLYRVFWTDIRFRHSVGLGVASAILAVVLGIAALLPGAALSPNGVELSWIQLVPTLVLSSVVTALLVGWIILPASVAVAASFVALRMAWDRWGPRWRLRRRGCRGGPSGWNGVR